MSSATSGLYTLRYSMVVMGATNAKKMNAISGATSSRLARRRRARALRSCWISVLLKEPLIELFAEVLAIVGPEDAVGLQTYVDVGGGQDRKSTRLNSSHVKIS